MTQQELKYSYCEWSHFRISHAQKLKLPCTKQHCKETVPQKHKPRQLSIECPMILGFQNHLYNTKKKNRTKGKYC